MEKKQDLIYLYESGGLRWVVNDFEAAILSSDTGKVIPLNRRSLRVARRISKKLIKQAKEL